MQKTSITPKKTTNTKKSGLSVSLGGMAAQNIANITAPIKRAGQVKDKLLKTLKSPLCQKSH